MSERPLFNSYESGIYVHDNDTQREHAVGEHTADVSHDCALRSAILPLWHSAHEHTSARSRDTHGLSYVP